MISAGMCVCFGQPVNVVDVTMEVFDRLSRLNAMYEQRLLPACEWADRAIAIEPRLKMFTMNELRVKS